MLSSVVIEHPVPGCSPDRQDAGGLSCPERRHHCSIATLSDAESHEERAEPFGAARRAGGQTDNWRPSEDDDPQGGYGPRPRHEREPPFCTVNAHWFKTYR